MRIAKERASKKIIFHCDFRRFGFREKKKEKESGGMKREKKFQFGQSKNALDSLDVPSGHHVGYTHPTPKKIRTQQEDTKHLCHGQIIWQS